MTLDARTMPEKENRYIAYQKLRVLDSLTSSIMRKVAYGYLDGEALRELCTAQREAFEEWIRHAESMASKIDGPIAGSSPQVEYSE